MPATKIINVLKDDTYDEILSLFITAPADEVVFVLPKKSKVFGKEAHFASFSEESKKMDKKISVMCSSPEVNQLASKFGFGVLGNKQAKTASINYSQEQPIAIKSRTSFATGTNDDVFDDSADAYTNDVIVPSDEKIGIQIGSDDGEDEDLIKEANEEEDDIYKDEIEHIKKPAKKSKEPEVENDQDEYKEEELTEEDAEEEVPEGFIVEDGEVEDGGLIANDPNRPEAFLVASPRRTATGKRLVRKPIQKPGRDIESVWGAPSEGSIWGDMSKKKSGSSNLFGSPTGRKIRASQSNFKRKAITIGAGLVVVAGLIFAYSYSGSAKISIKPIEKTIDTKIKVEASKNFDEVDTTFNKLPGQEINVEKTATQEFQATGQKEVAQKARGKITVYNEYSTSPQPLIATTRFQTDSGLVFKTLQSIVVPGSQVVSGKVVAGKIDVEVIADKAGQEYNIAPTKFGVIAFKEKGDLERYAKIYGQSTEATKGGIVGMAKVVTAGDYSKAIETVTEKAKTDVTNAIKEQAKELKILDPLNITIKKTESTAKEDEASDKFTVSVTANSKTVAFKQDELFKLIKESLEKSQEMDVLPEKLNIEFYNAIFVEDKHTLGFDLVIKGNGYTKIDQDKIINDLLNKKEEEIRNYLQKAPGVGSAKVVLSPFWIKRVPNERAKVQLKIEY